MGDKSPKSQQKNKAQKQSKADAANKQKARAIADKKQTNVPSAARKKK